VAGAAVTALLSGLLAANVAVRGQDDSYYAFSDVDLEVSQQAYDLPGDIETIGGLTAYYPEKYEHIADITQVSLASRCSVSDTSIGCLLEQAPSRIVISPASDNYGVVLQGLPEGWTDTVARSLVASGRYDIVWHEEDAWVLDWVEDPS